MFLLSSADRPKGGNTTEAAPPAKRRVTSKRPDSAFDAPQQQQQQAQVPETPTAESATQGQKRKAETDNPDADLRAMAAIRPIYNITEDQYLCEEKEPQASDSACSSAGFGSMALFPSSSLAHSRGP